MSRVLVAALMVCAARAEDYAGGAMPQYGGAADYDRAVLADYRGHSPDTPVSLDYKYEEELQGETDKSPKYANNVNRWRKPGKAVQRRPARDDVKEELELQGNEADSDVTQAKTSRRLRQRARGRRDKFRRDDALSRRRAVADAGRFVPANPDDEDGITYLENDYHDNSNKYREDGDLSPRETTSKVIRRKPRDRIFAPPPPVHEPSKMTEFTIDDEEEKPNRRMKGEKFGDPEYWSGEERDRSQGRMRPTQPSFDSAVESDMETVRKEKGRLKPGAYQDYDYYSMKKHENLKTKLPVLLRRTTTMVRMWTPPHSSSPGPERPMWGGRRFGADTPSVEPSPESPPLVTAPPTQPSLTTAAATTTIAANAVNATTPTVLAAPLPASINVTELSLAEQSRLSILKKSKMKENVKGSATKKPPVLLHVTSRMPTVVMVEPHGTADPWMRAREVSGDSPEMLEKVKRLMRQKLVASAKSIRDLTDNWDDTVCDYIDVSMLNDPSFTAAAPPALSPRASLPVACFCLLIIL